MRANSLCCLLALAAMAFTYGTVDAASNCKKGIPCGDSFIAPNKTCRIVTTAATSTAPRAATSGAVAAPAAATAATAAPPTAGASNATWIGSVSDGVYFRAGCSAARDLASHNRRSFRSEGEALAAGFRRSSVQDC
jgi:hypothetical protein